MQISHGYCDGVKNLLLRSDFNTFKTTSPCDVIKEKGTTAHDFLKETKTKKHVLAYQGEDGDPWQKFGKLVSLEKFGTLSPRNKLFNPTGKALDQPETKRHEIFREFNKGG